MTLEKLKEQTEKKAKELYLVYLLWLEFMSEDLAQYRLITELNKLTNLAIKKAVKLSGTPLIDLKIERDMWHNVFAEERQGIAKDKFSNIKRVVRNELQEGYNHNLNQIWKLNPNIIGRRIRLSRTGKNHCEICKNMVGAYPIWFEWTKFHINCQCEQFPIYGKVGVEIKLPNRAVKFVAKNKHRFDNWKDKPYWLEYFK